MYSRAAGEITAMDVRAAQSAPLFRGLDTEVVAALLSGARRQMYRRRAVIVEPDRSMSAVLLIERGRVRVGRISTEGEEVTVRMLAPGDLYAPARLCAEARTKDIARAVVDRTAVYYILGERLEALLQSHADIAVRALKLVEASLGESYDRIELLRFESVRVRLARLLASKASSDGTLFDTHEDLAADVGACRDQVGRVLRDFARQGLIHSERHRNGIRIDDPDSLLRDVVNLE